MQEEYRQTGAEPQKPCPESPSPVCPPDDPDPDYSKIPSGEREAIDDKRNSAKTVASQAYEKNVTDAEDVKAGEKAVFDVAMRKYQSAVQVLKTKITVAKQQLEITYKQCLRESITNKCSSAEENIPEDKRAICVATLKQGLAKQDVEFQKELKALNEKKADAVGAWEKAKEQFDAAVCIAAAIKTEAEKTADVEWRKDLSKALEAACKV